MTDTRTVDYAIIGGGIAGTTAADGLRKKSTGSVMIVTDEPHPLYSRVRLPDYLVAQIPRERVFMKDEAWYRERGIDLVRERSVRSLSLADRSVRLDDGSVVRYGTLLLAMGGAARHLSCEGADWDGVHYLRTVDDADRILASLPAATRAVVVGGGFIGLELARCFAHHHRPTTMVLMEPRFWPAFFDETANAWVDRTLRARGVEVRYSEQLHSIRGHGPLREAVMASGNAYPCDIMGVGIGISTIHPFVKDAGLAVRKGIVTDEYFRTHDPHVYAAGDVTEFFDLTLGRSNQLGNWSNAMEQGKVSALNMAGEPTPYRFVGSYVITIFGLPVGLTGDPSLPPEAEVILRGSPDRGSYARLIVRHGVIKGAAVLNAPKEHVTIGQLIKQEIRIDHARSQLADPAFDLKSLLKPTETS
jgi:NADPH-dependent 2,4-dienoyl-CoA reductase/sulfur reductase-like enzyme